MKPKTVIQKRVVELSAKLKPITEKQKAWAFEKCLEKFFVRTKNTLYCLECGETWKNWNYLITTLTGCTCPSCGSALRHYEGYRPMCRDSAYFSVITTKAEFQVVRMFWVHKTLKKEQKADYFFSEVMQFWIDEKGSVTPMSRTVNGLSRYFDQWIFQSEIEVRPSAERNQRYYINPYKIFPEKKILPIIKRNGFKGNFHDLVPHVLFSAIVKDRFTETLLKSGQIELLSYLIKKGNSRIENVWPSVKICIRNNYIVKDAGLWLDQIELLKFFGKDLHSPKYVCPEDLRKEHERLSAKKHEIDRKKRLQQELEELEEEQQEYEEQKGKFFDIQFQDNDLIIEPLKCIEDFINEGEYMKHCVYSNEYYKKADSLILSAKIDNKPIETIELSLKDLTILQARGRGNMPTQHHDSILNLVRNNIKLIAERIQYEQA